MIRINANAIGIKTPIRINETMKKVKDTFKFQRKVIKAGLPEGENQAERLINYYDGQVKSVDYIIDYISDMLDLNAKQIKQLNNTDFPKVESLSRQIASKMLHYNDNDKGNSTGKK